MQNINRIVNMHVEMYYWIVGLVVLSVTLVISTIYAFARFQRVRHEMNEAGILHFEKGNVESINPDLSLHEQANFLPYNKKYEFPKQKLELGKLLGAGAFGVVVKGMAAGIKSSEQITIVAVKMLKATASNEEIRALVSELKILANLGLHLNIVNLLGAVTKDIAKHQLMVIVEYCRFGNVQSFLIKHRALFIDQINPEDDTIDSTTVAKEYSNHQDSGYGNFSLCSGAYEHLKQGMDSGNVETSFVTATSDPSKSETMMSPRTKYVNMGSSADQMGVRHHSFYAPLVTTSALVCWSFQIATGMDFLSSRRVLHGDLAARNVLLSEDNVVKICDFGLARSLYESNYYKKTSDALVPLKWLAIESVCDHVFSTSSDVWSFGILMWELFSLGETPYPGMDANQDLFIKLRDGYRMEKPNYATEEIYDIMLHCWKFDPLSRPSFKALEGRLRKLLARGVAEQYIDLNEEYVEMNAKNFGKGQIDYLALMGLPDDSAPPIPKLVQPTVAPVYLPMKPIFSSDGCQNVSSHIHQNSLPVGTAYLSMKPILSSERK